ncbi:MAG: hypothetical protein OEV40_07520 [Acidimicrobiia bacterium]|nr:hypothetical protein [Acidimicrobiia bacterium]
MGEVVAIVNQLAFIDGVGFDPFFRGLLSVLTGFVVLVGSTYLVIATNTGVRQGFMIAAGALFGWLFLMGIIWTIYGIGWAGQAPTWTLLEINVDDAGDVDDGLLFSEVSEATVLTRSDGAAGLPAGGLGTAPIDRDAIIDRIDNGDPDDPENTAALARADALLAEASTIADIDDQDLAQEAALLASRELELDDWRYLVASDAVRGEAQAAVDAFLVEEGVFEAGDYVPDQFGAFTRDGKPVLKEDANVIDRVLHTLNETFLHPVQDAELIVVQVQGATNRPTLPGQPPPVAAVDSAAPLVSIVMERDRGGPLPAFFSGLRFTPAMFTVFSGLIFAALAWNMHVRDQRESKIRTAAG